MRLKTVIDKLCAHIEAPGASPNRELDIAVHIALGNDARRFDNGWGYRGRDARFGAGWYALPRYTSSLEDALRRIPATFARRTSVSPPHSVEVEIYGPDWCVIGKHKTDEAMATAAAVLRMYQRMGDW